jgi:hypothetical protein
VLVQCYNKIVDLNLSTNYIHFLIFPQEAVQQVIEDAQSGKLESRPGCTLKQTFENQVNKNNLFLWEFWSLSHSLQCHSNILIFFATLSLNAWASTTKIFRHR